jgi:hypothetical protein
MLTPIIGDELLEIIHRQILARDQRDWHLGNQADRGEIGLRIVERLLVERLGLGVGADRADEEVVAIRRAISDAFGTGLTAGAGDVFDHHLLAQNLAHSGADHAAEHVGRTAGGKRDHHGNRAGGIVLGAYAAGERHEGGQHAGYRLQHRVSSRACWADPCPSHLQRSSRDPVACRIRPDPACRPARRHV